MENVPGGDWRTRDVRLTRVTAIGILGKSVLDKLEKHHPTTYDGSISPGSTSPSPRTLLQGGVVPTVRNSIVEFDGGKCAIALGDVHSMVDPMMGQGANVASYAAFVLGEEIVDSDVLDARFCEKVDLIDKIASWVPELDQYDAGPAVGALGMLLGTMSQNSALADQFTENFNYPESSGTACDAGADPCLDRPDVGADAADARNRPRRMRCIA